jgi:hypothetical protein
MSDLLYDEIIELQKSYKAVLVEASDSLFEKDTGAVLDEINVFWHKNKRLVQSALEYLSTPYRTYIFTAATILDLADYEHYPFLCFGDHHVWDDPIYGYIYMALNSPEEKFNDKMRNQIRATIKDNIEILEKVNDKIFVLPVRLLSGIDKDLVQDATEQAFFSLFTVRPHSLDEYYESYNTIDDIVLGLHKGVESAILLNKTDKSSDDLKHRFSVYKLKNILPLPNAATDAVIFSFALRSYLSQAFDILLTCSGYQLTPYIRSRTTFQYLLILSGNLADSAEYEALIFRSSIAHIHHNSFDKMNYTSIAINEFVQKIKDSNFEKRVFDSLLANQITMKTPSVTKTAEIIKKELSCCFDK